MRKVTFVRIDGDTKHEVHIPVGETVIGRGSLMQCVDKRVSRNHALVKVSEDGKVELTTTSKSPCFYNDDKEEILQSNSVELKLGDQFSFLRDSYCFCVKIRPDSCSGSPGATCNTAATKNGGNVEAGLNEVKACDDDSAKLKEACSIIVTSPANDAGEEASVIPTDVGSTADTSGKATVAVTPTKSPNNTSSSTTPNSAEKHLPRWLLAATQRAKQTGRESSCEQLVTKEHKTGEEVGVTKIKSPREGLDQIRDNNGASGWERNGDNGEAKQPALTVVGAHQMSDDSGSEEPNVHSLVPAQQAARTNELNKAIVTGENSDGDSAVASSANSNLPVTSPARVPCKYGAACYRKNPEHQANFSHAGDPDYVDDTRPECPYGIDCYRKNQLHKQQYKHTKKPLKKRQRTNTSAPANAAADSEEDDYDYSDPFLNDGSSDDYAPTDSDSDVSASEGEAEDLKRTRKEANKFLQGKRKH